MIKLAIASFAHMHAYNYARVLRSVPDAELTGVFDDDKNRGEDAAKQFGTDYFDSFESLLKTDIDGVIICSENSKHVNLTLAAASHKKHVLCEKPIATNIEDGRRMVEACEKAGVELRIAFPSRFLPPVREFKELIDSGRLGRILAVRGTNHGQMPGGWFIDKDKSGGGAVMDHTVHVADLMRWFFNKEFKKVYAEKGTLLHDVDIDDCGLLSMEMEDGIFATLDASWSRPKSFPTWGDLTMEVVGTNGVAYLDKFAQNLLVYQQGEPLAKYEYWGTSSDYNLIDSFVRLLKGDAQPMATGRDGLKVLELAIAAYKSAEEHKPVLL